MISPSTIWRPSPLTLLSSSPSTSSSSYCCCGSSSSCSSVLFSFRRRSRRRNYLTKLSLDPNPSSSSSCSDVDAGSGKTVPKNNKKKMSTQIGDGNEHLVITGVNDGKMTNHKLSTRLRWFFAKRPLWRRIFFASNKVRSIILLNVIALVYASNIPVVKEVEAIMDPATFTVVRFVVSAVPFIPFIYKARGDVQTRAAGIELGIWVSLGYIMQAVGLLTSDAGRASFIACFTVIVVPILDALLGVEVPARTWFGALMSVLGVFLLESSGSPPSIGDLLNFLSAVFFGVHMLRTEHISRSMKKENFLALLGYEVCVIAISSTAWYFMGGWFGSMPGWDPGSWTWTLAWGWVVGFPWIPALYTGVFSTGICLWVEMSAMRNVSATETAIIYGLEPLWGAGFAWFLLGERWGSTGWIGAFLVLGGSLTVQIFGASSPSKFTEENISEQGGRCLVSEEGNELAASKVLVSSRENLQHVLKK